jgi:hypothetical protein
MIHGDVRYSVLFRLVESPQAFFNFNLVRDDVINLPSPEGEVACLIDATLDVQGTLVDVISVHFGNTQHFWDR